MKLSNSSRYSKSLAAATAAMAIAGTASAATILGLNADTANSSAAAYGGVLANTLNDGFAYDPDAPVSALPQQTFNPGAAGFHHALNSVALLSYTLGAAHTTTAADTIIFVDLYGRSAADCVSCVDRDDNIDVTLFNGDYSTIVGVSMTGISIDNSAGASAYARATFALPVGTTFDRLRVTGNDSDGNVNNNYFTLMETRAAAVPEPSVGLFACLGLAAVALRRRRK